MCRCAKKLWGSFSNSLWLVNSGILLFYQSGTLLSFDVLIIYVIVEEDIAREITYVTFLNQTHSLPFCLEYGTRRLCMSRYFALSISHIYENFMIKRLKLLGAFLLHNYNFLYFWLNNHKNYVHYVYKTVLWKMLSIQIHRRAVDCGHCRMSHWVTPRCQCVALFADSDLPPVLPFFFRN